MKTIRFIIVALLILLAGSIICILLFFLIYGEIADPHSYSASQNVKESKKIGVFIQEYKIDNIQVIDTNYMFPMESAWMEKGWYQDLTKSGKNRIPIIDSTARSKIVFELKKASKKDFFHTNNYLNRWVIQCQLNSSSGGLWGNEVVLTGITYNQDTIPFVINKLQKPYDYSKENAIPLFTFDLLRKVDED